MVSFVYTSSHYITEGQYVACILYAVSELAGGGYCFTRNTLFTTLIIQELHYLPNCLHNFLYDQSWRLLSFHQISLLWFLS